jgi:hypothetical protein
MGDTIPRSDQLPPKTEPRMADILDRLTPAPADRYRIDRPLAVGVGAERFLSEIWSTANLQDKHILPFFDSVGRE